MSRVEWKSLDGCRRQEPFQLSQVSLRVEPGEFVGLIGPNGSGKTSLLNCAMRFSKPTDGDVRVAGKDVWGQTSRWSAQHIAVVGQEFPTASGLRVREIVAMGRMPFQGRFRAESGSDRKLIEDALGSMAIDHLRDQAFQSLSGGEKQRVLLARALVQQPKLMILDEPTNHLDPKHQLDLLTRVQNLGMAVLASLHDLNLAAAFCDRLYVIKNGRIVTQGVPWDVLTPSLMMEVFGAPALVDEHPITGTPRITWKIM